MYDILSYPFFLSSSLRMQNDWMLALGSILCSWVSLFLNSPYSSIYERKVMVL
jgi:hypothetical protein